LSSYPPPYGPYPSPAIFLSWRLLVYSSIPFFTSFHFHIFLHVVFIVQLFRDFSAFGLLRQLLLFKIRTSAWSSSILVVFEICCLTLASLKRSHFEVRKSLTRWRRHFFATQSKRHLLSWYFCLNGHHNSSVVDVMKGSFESERDLVASFVEKYSQTTERSVKGKKSKDFQAFEEVSSRRESRQTGEPQVLPAHLTPEMTKTISFISTCSFATGSCRCLMPCESQSPHRVCLSLLILCVSVSLCFSRVPSDAEPQTSTIDAPMVALAGVFCSGGQLESESDGVLCSGVVNVSPSPLHSVQRGPGTEIELLYLNFNVGDM
jgi:hypothetical protein